MRGLNEFVQWLPSELDYSVRKAPYDKKLTSAQVETDDPQSMFTFLASEWHHAQLLTDQGALYAPEHQKTAQLQYAKFAAGIFDKYGLVDWLQIGRPDDIEDMRQHAQIAANRASSALRHPVSMSSISEGSRSSFLNKYHFELPFGLVFEEAVNKMQNDIKELAESNPSVSDFGIVKADILKLGVRATASYLSFAQVHLTDEQLTIPESQLE